MRSPQTTSTCAPLIDRELDATNACPRAFDHRPGVKPGPRSGDRIVPNLPPNEIVTGALSGRGRRFGEGAFPDFGVRLMQTNLRTLLIAAAAACIVLPSPAWPAGTAKNLRGTIVNVSGDTMQIKQKDGTSVTVKLAQDAKIASVSKASLADVKPGTFIGTAARPQPDGRLQAIEIHIFPESMRGTGEGNRAWDLGPGSSMTNGTAGQTASQQVNKVEGNTLTVKYRGGDKAVTVTPSTKVVALAPGDRNDLKQNEMVFIPAATPADNGSFEANRLTVGKDGVAPPM